MRRSSLKILAVLCMLLAAPLAWAGGRGPVLVELYTSQGCSACPPADAMIAELAQRDDVLPLALHVDYWDYIGWIDAFASPAHTHRQKAYARAVGSRTIYTPQIIVGGTDHVVGMKPMQIERLIQKHAEQSAPVSLALSRDDLGVLVEVEVIGAGVPKKMVIQIVRFDPNERVAIHTGENAGMTIDYSNVVTDWSVLDTWSGEERYSTRVDVDGSAAIVVQEAGPGAVLAVGRID